jgi:hypothetical protein
VLAGRVSSHQHQHRQEEENEQPDEMDSVMVQVR